DHGTLVVLIPTVGGLVAASDSRLTLDSCYCDGVDKFIEPAKPDRLLLVVTGRRGMWPVSIFAAKDPCEFIKTQQRDFDFGHVARDYVEAANLPLQVMDSDALIESCLRGVSTFLSSNPHRLDGSSAASVLTLASYDPTLQTSRIR